MVCYATKLFNPSIGRNKIYQIRYCSDVKGVQTYLHVFCTAGFSMKWLKLTLSTAVNIS